MNNGYYGTGGESWDNSLRIEKKALRRDSTIIGFGLLLVYAISIVVVLGIYWWVRAMLPRAMAVSASVMIENIASLAAYIISFAVPCAVIMSLIRIPRSVALPTRAPQTSLTVAGVFFCLGVSVAGGYLSELVKYFMESALQLTPIMPDMSPPQEPAAYAVYVVSIVIAPAFLEEALFRGIILQSLRRYGDGFALVASSILFAMAHGNLVQGPNAMIMGLAIGYFVLRTGSLWTGVIIHFVNNGLAVLLEFADKYTDKFYLLEEVLNTSYFIIYFVGGIAAALYLLTQYQGLFTLAPSRSGFSPGKRYLYFFTTVLQIILIAATVVITAGYIEAY